MSDALLVAFCGVTTLLVGLYMAWCVRTVDQERRARQQAELIAREAEAQWRATLRAEEAAYERLREDHESLIAHAYVREGNRFVRASRWPVE